MKRTQIINVQQKEIVSLVCDCCHVEVGVHDVMEFQEFLSINVGCGFGSILGDGNDYEADLCQYCVKKLLGQYLRLKSNYITGETFND